MLGDHTIAGCTGIARLVYRCASGRARRWKLIAGDFSQWRTVVRLQRTAHSRVAAKVSVVESKVTDVLSNLGANNKDPT